MGNWIVLVKTAEGTQTIALEADTAELSEDGKEVKFSNFGTLIEAYEAIESLSSELPREKKVEEVRKLIRSLSRFSVGSFKAEAVLGYYQVDDAQPE